METFVKIWVLFCTFIAVIGWFIALTKPKASNERLESMLTALWALGFAILAKINF